ncbi:STAS domain-containing protein [Vineibacter terrae]|uniref:STAS domain-containing protein n=1 Tax=Vineibacter terrae TaxID=2586908 RepID=UPI002E3049F0|nr:STAS domain-containing protein [Vineibacter terrae]HEX2890432.1 STAS domain-containing protein [Vineibacter terrae]
MAINDGAAGLGSLIADHEAGILAEWIRALGVQDGDRRILRSELETQCRGVLTALRQAISSGVDIGNPAYERTRGLLDDISRSRAAQGFSPSETATFIFSLKEPVFEIIRKTHGEDAAAVARDTWAMTRLLDSLGLHTMETYQRSRDAVIARQQEEIAELSTPVVKLWDGILALPLIGTLDSARTQVVMENLLQSIVDHAAEIAIIDITGVPTVDTLVAQHLLKTVAAARLMGADCLVSGIRPQIAQTMVHLGVELTVVSKATLADAFALALQRTGRAVVRSKAAADAATAASRAAKA